MFFSAWRKLEKELLSPANVVVDGNADRLLLLGATVVRSQSILDVRAAAMYKLCLVDLAHINKPLQKC